MNALNELSAYLRKFERRLRLRDGWHFAQQWLWLAALGLVLAQFAGRIWPLEQTAVWLALPFIAWALAVLLTSVFRPMPAMQVARRVDVELGLKERLATAMYLQQHAESRGLEPNLVERQKADALTAARRVDPKHDFQLSWQRRPLAIASILMIAAMLMAFVPNPMDEILAQRERVRETLQEEAEQIDELAEEIAADQELTPEEREELLRQLEELARELRENQGDPEEALADLSRIESELRRELDPMSDVKSASLESLAAQLEALAQQARGEDGEEIESMDEALRELAESLSELSQQQQASLAQALADMAAQAAQSGQMDLAQALSSMAQAALTNDSQAAQAAASQASQAMSSAQSQQALQDALQDALDQLQDSREDVSDASQSGDQQPNQPGNPSDSQSGSQSGSQTGNQSGSQSGNQGTSGQNPGSGQSPGSGQNSGQGQTAGGGGGTKANTLPPGTGSGGAGDPQGPGTTVDPATAGQQVYVPVERQPTDGEDIFLPGQDSGEGETDVTEVKDPLGGLNNPSLVPYSDVYFSYLSFASQTIEQSYIPPALKDYIRAYFSQLEP